MLNQIEVSGLWNACISFREAKAKDLEQEFEEILDLVVLFIERWMANSQNNQN